MSSKFTNKKFGNKPNSKGTRTGSKGKRNAEKIDDNSDCRDNVSKCDYYHSASNDWRWYANSPQLLKDVSSYAYGYPLGDILNLGQYADNMNLNAVPGIMQIEYIPSIGYTEDPLAPVNLAARNIYSNIRQSNSGAKNYDAPDLMLYLLAMDSANAYLAWMKRIYGVCQLANVYNRYYAKAVIDSMGVNYDEIITDLPGLRTLINTFAIRLGALAIPSHMSLMAKHQWMNSGLYFDNNSIKAQTYYFQPQGFYKFTLDDDGAGMLEFVNLDKSFKSNQASYWSGATAGAGSGTLKGIQEYGDMLLEGILGTPGEEDFNIMSGDIIKCYGIGGCYRPEGIDESYVVIPTYDEIVLSQINNATMFGQLDNYLDDANRGNLSITQSKNKQYLLYKPVKTYTQHKPINPAVMDRMINAKHSDVTPEFTMEATRLMSIPEPVTSGLPEGITGKLEYRSSGSEIVTRAFVFYNGKDAWNHTPCLKRTYEYHSNVTVQLWHNPNSATHDLDVMLDDLTSYFDGLCYLSVFDWHPAVSYALEICDYNTQEVVQGPIQPSAFNWDINNYTIIGPTGLRNMSQTALLSQFAIETHGTGKLA